MRKRAVVLASGGLDSTTTMAIAKHDGYDIFALSFDYGQRHKVELEAAKTVADCFGAKKHLILRLDLGAIGGSALTDDISVPHGRGLEEISSRDKLGRHTHYLRSCTKHYFSFVCPCLG